MIDYNVITKQKFELGAVDREKIKAYMGAHSLQNCDDSIDNLITKAVEVSHGKFGNTVISKRFKMNVEGGHITFGSFDIVSDTFLTWMQNCNDIMIISASAGFEVDRLIEKSKRLEGSMALALSALGSERVEDLLNRYCRDLKHKGRKEGYDVTPRCSPGYGDVSLENQCIFMNELDLQRQMGVSLNESFFMQPAKTVTAFLGIRWTNNEF